MINDDEESSTESSGSSETTEAAIPKAKQVNELPSSDVDKLQKRQRARLSIKEAMALFNQTRHINDCVLMDRMKSSPLSISKAS
jgi:hypothetical protein